MVAAAEKILNRKSGGLGSLIGATQATEAVEGENFLTGQALTGLDRWGVAFQSISAASGVAAVGLSIAGIDSPLDFGGWFRTAAAESAAPFRQIMANLQGMDFSTAPNTALSYSGTGTGDAAEALAAEKGLTTISGTEGGAYLQSLYLYGLIYALRAVAMRVSCLNFADFHFFMRLLRLQRFLFLNSELRCFL